MSYKEILKRASSERRKTDHIAWEGICTRCGIHRKAFGDEILEEYGDMRCDIRLEDERCHSPRCTGRIRWYGRIPVARALNFNDIRRRK